MAQDSDLADRAALVLKQNCWECHGPRTQQSGLRLDSRDAILKGGNSKTPAILSGDSAGSLIIRKITSTDPLVRMPMARKALDPAEIELLKQWIDVGSPWPQNTNSSEHWAYKIPKKKDFLQSNTQKNPIDYFISEKLKISNLEPTETADKHTLVRRTYLEMIGIPPSLEEIADFVNDRSDDAYERLLTQLVASPRYGEHQAVRWLDIARYADTNGYEKDRPRTMWPYRDWVINAFNDNMPFDQFITEQLAGDLLPNATESQKIATGFHRNAMLNEEGGIDAAEDRFKRTVDRTNTTGTALLGLTVACAQCHNHKYDAISRKEYYQLFAYFNDTEETVLPIVDEKVISKQSELDAMVAALNEEIIDSVQDDSETQNAFDKWVDEFEKKAVRWSFPLILEAASLKGATLVKLSDSSILATGDIPNDDTYSILFETLGSPLIAIRLEVLPHESLPGGGPGRGTILAEGDFLLTSFEMYNRDAFDMQYSIPLATASASYTTKNRSALQALDGLDDTGWSIKGGTGNAHRAVFVFSEATKSDKNVYRVVLRQDYIHQHTLGRFRVSYATASDNPGNLVPLSMPAFPYPHDIERILSMPTVERSEGDLTTLREFYFREVASEYNELREKREAQRKARPKLAKTLTMSPRTPARETRMYNRGEFLSPRQKVKADVPAVLHDMDPDQPQDRIALSDWLTSPENPLTARVLANQLWQQVFGRGIVETSEDFGVRGSPPSHPELLDWLAVELIDSGWDMQAMHKLMVSSDAFKRSSATTPEQLEQDPNNILLSRGPRFRLTAESIRDAALQAAGLLSATVGGPSVYPPEPAGVDRLAYSKSNWPTSEGDARHRRTMYTYWKRTSPYAGGTTFDVPSREETCVRRQRSNTPLQALTLMNDTVFTEIAQALGKRVLNQQGSVSDKIDYLFLAALSRPPDKVERKAIQEFFKQQRKEFKKNSDVARNLSGALGALTSTDELPELAAWVAVSRIVLNLDEMIVRG